MKYFKVLNSSAVSTTGCPLRSTSKAEELTITAPNTTTLLVSAVFKRSTAWPNSPSNLVDSEVSVSELLSVISRTASLLMVDLSMKTMTGRNRDKLRISFEVKVGIRASDSSRKKSEVGSGTEACANWGIG